MNFTATIFLALGMSMDAFAVSVSKGASLSKPNLREALRTGLIFGVVEAITPLIGWALGLAASRYVMPWSHWVAFGLLLFLGGRMMIEGLRPRDDNETAPPSRHSFWLLVVTAVATSLDAMAVGVGLAFLEVNIVTTSLAIGFATFMMATLGMMLGRFIGPVLGKRAEVLGGLVLMGIGCQIIYSHFYG